MACYSEGITGVNTLVDYARNAESGFGGFNMPSSHEEVLGRAYGRASDDPIIASLLPIVRENTLPHTIHFSLGNELYYHHGYAHHADSFTHGMRPDSYASPDIAQSGEDADTRFALPVREPSPDSVYEVQPHRWTGVIGPRPVQPTKERIGGGREVVFPHGTGYGTVKGPKPL